MTEIPPGVDLLSTLFDKIGDLYSANLDAKVTDQATIALRDQDSVRINKDFTEARNGYIVSIGGFTYYISPKGVRWISPPKLGINLIDIQSPVPTSIVQIPEGKRAPHLTENLVNWTKETIEKRVISSNPHLVSYWE